VTPVLKKYTGYPVQVLCATGEQALNTSTGYYYKPNKKKRTQQAIKTLVIKVIYSQTLRKNLQNRLSNSQGQGITTGACRGYLISMSEIA
jgi:hypothetical protein